MTKKGHLDWYILISVIGLMLFSIAFVYSASAFIAEARFGSADKFFWNHSLRVVIGLLFLFGFAKIDYHFWQKISKQLIFLSLIPLILVFIIGTPINGAYRWIHLGPFNFQPSELAKFALVVHLASILAKRSEYIKDFKLGLLPLLSWSLLICFLIAIQPNFSTALVVYLISFSLMFVGNVNILHLMSIGAVTLVSAGVYAISAPYRFQRILSYIGLAKNAQDLGDSGFQIQQAIIAFGNGGIYGVGPGQSMQSHLYLPESYGDFIFSIIGEEYGFIGAIILLAVFVLIFYRGIKIARKAPDNFGYFLASGIIITFAIYLVVSAGVNCGALPTTGLPMPFISYGGTAVIFYAAAIGILLNISSQSGIYPITSPTNINQSKSDFDSEK